MPTPNEDPKKSFIVKGVFGFGQIAEKLPLQKLTAKMAYCSLFAILFLAGTFTLYYSGKSVNGFPSAWDMRGIIVICLVIFFVGITSKKKD